MENLDSRTGCKVRIHKYAAKRCSDPSPVPNTSYLLLDKSHSYALNTGQILDLKIVVLCETTKTPQRVFTILDIVDFIEKNHSFKIAISKLICK